MALRRAHADEYAVRVNRAVVLLGGRSAAEVVRALRAEHGLSERQARRYVNAARERPGGVAVPGVPGNQRALYAFRSQVVRHWFMALRRRSQRTTVTWERMRRIRARWLPFLYATQPWPEARFDARTQGKSPVR